MEYIMLYHDFLETTQALTDAERGRLIVAMVEFARDGRADESALVGNERVLFPVFRRQIERERDEAGRTLIIEHRARSIGEMNYRRKGDRTAEIGIKICESAYQGRGLGRVILSLFIKELFSAGYTKIVLDTNLKNLRAQHVYELLGFQKVRVNPDSWTDQLGRRQSSVDYEMTPEHFRDRSADPGR